MDVDIEVIELPDLDGFRIEALLPNGHSVGYINIIVKGTVADLCDLCVKDSYLYLWPSFMPVFLSIQRKHNFQNKGIGSRLLTTAIEHSKSKGCSQMKGWMHGDKPRLEKFYRSFGFQISGINIELDLENMHNKAFKSDSQRLAF
ncbi:TPA: GNAT family N-acetyltransferase [Vibrio alginolyticus]|uniref:GNAT family N-acetyltransferase n=1 Tax=Vibrio alginolyticus TaxID=663 RepID=UPI003D7E1D6F